MCAVAATPPATREAFPHGGHGTFLFELLGKKDYSSQMICKYDK